MVGTSLLSEGNAKKPIRRPKNTIALNKPEVAGTINAFRAVSNRKRNISNGLTRTAEASREIARRIFNDRSDGACLRPTTDSMLRVFFRLAKSEPHFAQLER